MPRQQQVDDALERAFSGRKPSGKVKAQLDGHLMVVWHYSYRMLSFDLRRGEPVDWAFDPAGGAVPQGWKPTDRRILAAALLALNEDGQTRWQQQQHSKTGAAASASRPTTGSSTAAAESVAFEQRTLLSPRFGSVTLARGHEVEEKGSRFLALVCFPVATRAAADAAIALLRSRPELAGATHRIASYRAADGTEWMDDDGEDRAGAE